MTLVDFLRGTEVEWLWSEIETGEFVDAEASETDENWGIDAENLETEGSVVGSEISNEGTGCNKDDGKTSSEKSVIGVVIDGETLSCNWVDVWFE